MTHEPTDEQARRLGRMVYDVFLDVRPITEDVAAMLEKTTHIPAAVWLALEADYPVPPREAGDC